MKLQVTSRSNQIFGSLDDKFDIKTQLNHIAALHFCSPITHVFKNYLDLIVAQG